VLNQEVADLLDGPAMIIVSTRDDRFRATIGRGCGAVHDVENDHIDTFVSRTQWPDLIAAAAPGQLVAATFVRPSDYRCFQIKGEIIDIAPADADAERFARMYLSRMLLVLGKLGITRQQLAHTFNPVNLMRLRFRPLETYDQTPGPNAGVRMGAGA